MTTGERLKEARHKAGLTQTEAATRAGISQAYWARIELGVRCPFDHLEMLERVARAAETTIAELRA